jgi:hypothetical protein
MSRPIRRLLLRLQSFLITLLSATYLLSQETPNSFFIKNLPLLSLDSFHVNLFQNQEFDFASISKHKLYELEYMEHGELKKTKVRPFEKIEISNDAVALITIGSGRYIPNFQLLTWSSKEKKVIEHIELADSFVDAGSADFTSCRFLKKNLFKIFEKDFGERDTGTPCECVETTYKIANNGSLIQLEKKSYSIDCE